MRRPVLLEGHRPSDHDSIFANEALCFLDAESRWVSFVDGDGHAITVDVVNFPHLALWNKIGAPFLSIETWTGYGDPHDFDGELFDKPAMLLLAPGDQSRHAV